MSIACFSIFPTESENSIRHQAEDTKRSFVFRPAFKMVANFPNFPRKHNGGDSDAEDDIAIVDITDSDNDSHRQLYIESNREPPPTPLESMAIINRIGVIKAQKVGPDGRAADDTEDGRSSSSSIVSTLNSAEDAAKITRICKHCSRSGCNPTITITINVERYLGEAKMMAGAGLDADDEAEDADDVREAEPKRKMRKTRPKPRRH